MMRLNSLTLLACGGAAWFASMCYAGEVARPAPAKAAGVRTQPAIESNITAPQRLTGFYHPQGVGVGPVSAPAFAPTTATTFGRPFGGSCCHAAQPVMPMIGPVMDHSCCQHSLGGIGGLGYFGTYDPYLMDGIVDPYSLHFGPGYHRYGMEGHVRYPYYSYRRPWYFPGHPSFNRDVNLPW